MSDDEQMTEFMRLQLRGSFWNVGYHEAALRRAHKHIAVVRSFLKHTDFSITDEKASEAFEDGCEMENCESPIELAQWLLGNALHSITYHEEELKKSHAALGSWKALMLRARFELPLAEIEEEALKGVAER